jgi:hypothetical protein
LFSFRIYLLPRSRSHILASKIIAFWAMSANQYTPACPIVSLGRGSLQISLQPPALRRESGSRDVLLTLVRY